MRNRSNTSGARIMARVLLWSLALFMVLALVGCSRSATPTSAPARASAVPPSSATPGGGKTPVELPSPTAVPGSQPAAPTGVPGDGGTREPVPGLPSDQLDGGGQAGPSIVADSPDYPYPPAPDRDLYRLAAQLAPGDTSERPAPSANPNAGGLSPGREDTFWLVDFRKMSVYQADFELRLVTPSAYWYVEKGVPVLQPDLERAADEFEHRIYPRITAALGQEWVPGIDNDPRLNILHAGLQGVAGYYSSSDEHPSSIYPYSNEREILYINARSLSVGKQSYLEVLAHELQHAIHWNGDPSEDTWVNEGLSELAVPMAGYRSASISRFLRTPTVSLIHWPLDNAHISAHYGGASLFMHYLAEHYSREGDLVSLVQEPADGIAGINAYLDQKGYNTTFREVFGDWVVANLLDEDHWLYAGDVAGLAPPEGVANLLDEDHGLYGYADLDVDVSIVKSIDRFTQIRSQIPQYSAEYLRLTSLTGPIRIRFEGPTQNRLFPVGVGEPGCWWSNSGDSISSTLTRTVDLRGQTQATLNYQVWHDVEEDWDYGYVQVSVDGGSTWEILETPNTTPENPIGNSFGPGYTGHSHDWITEEIDLSRYSGQKVQVRFHYVTDDAVNGAGLCFRSISIPEAGVLENDPKWEADGFVLTGNAVGQDYLVQVVQTGPENRVSSLVLDEANAGEIVVPGNQGRDRVVVVAALAPYTLQNAPYTLTVEPAR